MASNEHESRLLTDFIYHDLAADGAIALRGTYRIPVGTDAVKFRIKCGAHISGGAAGGVFLYIGQPAVAGSTLFDSGGVPLAGAKRFILGNLSPDIHSTFTVEKVIEDFDWNKPLTWQLGFGALGGIETLAGGDGPGRITITPDGTKAYMTSSFFIGTFVSSYQLGHPDTGKIYTGGQLFDRRDGTNIPVNQGVTDLDSTNTRLVVTCLTGTVAHVVNTTTNAVLNTTSALTGNPVSCAIDPGGTFALIGTDAGNIYKLLINNPFTLTGPLVLGAGATNAIAFTADGTVAYVTNSTGGSLRKVNTGPLTSGGTVATGGAPIDIKRSPDNTLWFVSQESPGKIRQLNPATDLITQTYTLPFNAPTALAISPVAVQSTNLVRTAYVSFNNGFWDEFYIGGEFAGQSHTVHLGQLTLNGNLGDIAVNDFGEIYIVSGGDDFYIKFPGSRIYIRPGNLILNEELSVFLSSTRRDQGLYPA